MKLYTVEGGVLRLGPGQAMTVSVAQLARRRHMLEVVAESEDGNRIEARSTRRCQFKAGEVVGLPDLPASLVNILIPVGEPDSNTDKAAAAGGPRRRRAGGPRRRRAGTGPGGE